MIQIKRFNEDSFTKMDIPEQFFIVTSYERLDKNNIASGIVDGVTGISGSAKIVLDFMGVGRNCIVTMDGPSVVQKNSLTRIMYDNPHFLVSNDMEDCRT